MFSYLGVILVFQLLPRLFSLQLQAYSPVKLVVSGLLQTGEKNKGKKEETIVLCLSMLCFNLYSNCAELNGWGEAELPAI